MALDRDFLRRHMDALLGGEVSSGRLGGASLAVEHRGERVYTACFGVDKPDSIYKIYSMSKPVTAVAVMTLYERGLIDLWQPVSDFIPAFKDMRVATPEGVVRAETPVTLNHLLNMTSGMVYPSSDGNASERAMADVERSLKARSAAGERFTTAQVCSELASAPLMFEPGQGFKYGVSADILGGVIELVSGMSVGEYLKTQIFEPLNMQDTAFYVPSEKHSRLTRMYMRDPDGQRVLTAGKAELEWLGLTAPTQTPPFLSCGGGLYSTLEDYARFARMLLNEGRYDGLTLLSPATVRYMRSSHMTDIQRRCFTLTGMDGYDYGCLMRIMRDNGAAASNGSIGEFGWDGLPGCYFFVDPATDTTFIYMQQILEGPDWTLRRKLRQIVFSAMR